jgi:hypothetical protein
MYDTPPLHGTELDGDHQMEPITPGRSKSMHQRVQFCKLSCNHKQASNSLAENLSVVT